MTQTSTSPYAFCGSPVSADDLGLICEIINDYGLPRSELANTICELLDWTRPNGKLKTVECLQFLELLASRGHFQLPEPKNRRAAKPRRAKRTEAGSVPFAFEGALRELGPVSLESVATQRERDHWKELIDRYHYLGYRVPFGASLRYFIKARDREVVLGCLQFSSPAWKLKARDRWIGWDEVRRRHYLQHIVQNSRFLILPEVRVKGLASHVLSRVVKHLAADWATAYGIRPVLLETFVEEDRYEGTCYRAANWICVGRTRGRGRMDRHTQACQPVKSVWLYPLRRDWRRHLCGVEGAA